MPAVAAVLDYLESTTPTSRAAEWDNVGLLLGDRAAPVERVMTCLTITPESSAEAIENGVQLVVTHHPILFRPIKRLTGDNAEGRMLLGLLQAGIAVYSPHTAFDNAPGGINEILARRLGLSDLTSLRKRDGSRQCKVVVFVPPDDQTQVADAMFAAGAGHIGAYRECSFRLAGTGTFFGSDETNPTVGQKGRREEVGELRLEVVCPESAVEAVLAAMRRAHSYEEPAFDVYALKPRSSPLGDGRLGRLERPVPLDEFARSVKAALNAALVQVVGDEKQSVARVAIVCGAGGELLNDAMRARADVFLTGELRFHDYLAARLAGLALVLPGHYATERCGIEALAEQLQRQFPNLTVWASRSEADPVRWQV